MDHIAEILKQVGRIMAESPWVNDDYGNMTCFFCGEERPDHRCCPYDTLKVLEQQLLREMAALIEVEGVEG